MVKPAKNTICLWYDGGAEDAARFYAKTFPIRPSARCTAPRETFLRGRRGRVDGRVYGNGHSCLGLNGGPAFKHNEAFSFQVATADQAETDRYWDAIVGNGGQESACGWCKDRWGCPGRLRPLP